MQHLTWPGDADHQLLARATALLERGDRAVLGIAGAPACGKSTLTEWLVATLSEQAPGRVAHVGMDAFHLGHRVLQRRGLVPVKGAPRTFDPVGYAHLLERVRRSGETIYAPVFHREIEDSIAHEVEIGPDVSLLVTEGNYLLLDEPPWDRVRPLLDEAWFVHLDDGERHQRLLSRHLHHGHDKHEALERTYGSDEANAQLVNGSAGQADLWIEVVA